MNILLIIVILIIAGYGIAGHKMGFIKIVFSMLSVIAALVITALVAPIISKSLKSNENIMGHFSEKIGEALEFEDIKIDISNKEDFIKELGLPSIIETALLKDAELTLDAKKFEKYISDTVAGYIINAVSFVAVFIIAIIVLRILCVVLDLVSKLPLINEINKMAGFAAGLFHGVIIVWIFMALITAFGANSFGKNALNMVSESKVLSIIYDYNPITKYVINSSEK